MSIYWKRFEAFQLQYTYSKGTEIYFSCLKCADSECITNCKLVNALVIIHILFYGWNTSFSTDLLGSLTCCIQSLSNYNMPFLLGLSMPQSWGNWEESDGYTKFGKECMLSPWILDDAVVLPSHFFIGLCWGLSVLLVVAQPLLCPKRSLFLTCALILRWDRAAGGDPALGCPFDPPHVGWWAAHLGAGSTLKQEWGSGSLSKSKGGRNCAQVSKCFCGPEVSSSSVIWVVPCSLLGT